MLSSPAPHTLDSPYRAPLHSTYFLIYYVICHVIHTYVMHAIFMVYCLFVEFLMNEESKIGRVGLAWDRKRDISLFLERGKKNRMDVGVFLHLILERSQSSSLIVIFSKIGEKLIVSRQDRGVLVRGSRKVEICCSRGGVWRIHWPEKCRIILLHRGLLWDQ